MEGEQTRVEVERSPTRCPYCHDDVDRESAGWIACAGCLARHHKGCWVELGKCASCGKPEALKRMLAVESAAPGPREGARAWQSFRIPLVLALAVALLGIGVVTLRKTSPEKASPPALAPSLPAPAGPRVELAREKTALPSPPSAPRLLEIQTAFPAWCNDFKETARTKLVGIFGETRLGSKVGAVAVSADASLGIVDEGAHCVLVSFPENASRRLLDARTGSTFALSPGGKRLLVGDPSGELALWNVEDRRSPSRVRDLHGQGSVECAVFSPDGLRALTGGADKTASLWDLEGAKKLWSAVAHSDAVTTVAFLPDGKRALTGSKGMGVALWDLETGVELNRINCNAPVLSLAISPDGKRALVGCTDEHVRLLVNGFRGESCMRLLDGGHKKGTVGAVAFSPDGSTGLSCGSDGAVRLWNVDSLEQTDVVRLSQGETVALAAAFAGDGRSFFLATTGGAFLRFELK